MKPVLEKLNEVFNVTHCRATTQQGEDDKEENDGDMPVNEEEVLEANLRNLYQIREIAKSYATKVVLEKQSLKGRLKNIKEVKNGRNGNVSSRLGKGIVNIISEEHDDFNPNLSEKELKEREKSDRELDVLNALKAKFEA